MVRARIYVAEAVAAGVEDLRGEAVVRAYSLPEGVGVGDYAGAWGAGGREHELQAG